MHSRARKPAAQAYLITGTDTGIGKTTVACAIAAALSARKLRVGVCKPAETGCKAGRDGSLVPADAVLLQRFSGCAAPLEEICPFRFREPLAPLIAARRAGQTIRAARLRAAIERIRQRHDVTLVESAGGLLVPVTEKLSFADLAAQLDLSLVLVVGNRLGALNHARLTVQYARELGLRLKGYVINMLGPKPDLAATTNIAALHELLGEPLGIFPYIERSRAIVAQRRRLAALAEISLNIDAFEPAKILDS